MIDLHMHSLYSEDGEFSPADLVNKCADLGISRMSITDHNCVKANFEAEGLAEKKGIAYVPGIEIDCVYEGNGFHVLGYGIDYRSADFERIEKNIRSQSFEASLKMLERTQTLGFHVTENDMWNLSKNSYWSETWTGELFGEALLMNPAYKDHPLLAPYRSGGARGDNPYVNFYWDFYAPDKPCHVEMHYPKMREIIDLIHDNHGFAVLAHPGVNLKGKQHLLPEIAHLGMDGIEAFSSYHLPDQASGFCSVAEQYQLFITCGSDFHGKTKPSIKIGNHGCTIFDENLPCVISSGKTIQDNIPAFDAFFL